MITIEGIWDNCVALNYFNNPDGGRTLLGESIFRNLYRKQWYLTDTLAKIAGDALVSNLTFKDIDLLVPIPFPGPNGEYDKIAHLTDYISKLTTIPRCNALARYGMISEYADVIAEASMGGMKVKNPDALKNRNVLLIEGIICTGNTAHLAAQAVRAAGVASVSVLAFSKLERRSLGKLSSEIQGEL